IRMYVLVCCLHDVCHVELCIVRCYELGGMRVWCMFFVVLLCLNVFVCFLLVFVFCFCFFFFFSSRRRHTRCYRDWSSDVCSSDLLWRNRNPRPLIEPLARRAGVLIGNTGAVSAMLGLAADDASLATPERAREIGRASCRERGETPAGGGPVTETESRNYRHAELSE